jgi:hypothetical protein
MRRLVTGLIVLAHLALGSAHAVKEVRDPVPPIHVPCEVIDLAGKALTARVGADFFSRYVYFHSLIMNDDRGVISSVTWGEVRGDSVKRMVPHRFGARPEVWYQVGWELRLEEVSRTYVSMDIDPEGHILNDPTTLRIPDCVNDPGECVFPIGQDDVLSIARTSGFFPVSAHLMTDFRWFDEFATFAWSVVAHVEQDKYPMERYPEPNMVVDANSGEILFSGLK